MELPNQQDDIAEHLRERARGQKRFLWYCALPTMIALGVGAWLGWFPGM